MQSYPEQQAQHTVYIQRLATKLLNEDIYPSYKRAYRAARRIVLDADTIATPAKLNAITKEIAQALEPIYSEAWQGGTKELEEYAVYEAAYQAALLDAAENIQLTVPADKKIKRYIDKALMSLEGGRASVGAWADFVGNNTKSNVDIYLNQIRAGYANGESVSQITKRLKTVTDGVIKNQAEAMARTGMQHYANQASEAMYDDNDDVITGYVYLAVLDNRTTTLCAGRDGNYYSRDDNRPPLPAHWNCRSRYAPRTGNEKNLDGKRTAVGGRDGDDAQDAFETRKNRMATTGKVKRRGRQDDEFFDPSQVSAKTDYDKWLSKQPEWFIDDTLGPARAKLFKSGGLSMGSFNDLTGRQLNLRELKERHPTAFKKAGLD